MEDWTSALTILTNFWICSSCTSMWVLALIQGFPESYLSGLRISRGLTCLTAVSLPLTALSGQFIDQIVSSDWCHFRYLLQIYYCVQSTEDLFMTKALATGVLWRLLVKVSRNYNWLAFPVSQLYKQQANTFPHCFVHLISARKAAPNCFSVWSTVFLRSSEAIFRSAQPYPNPTPNNVFFPAWWHLALVCNVVFVRVLNRTLLDGQWCELLKSNMLTNGSETGRFQKTSMEIGKARSSGIPRCICGCLGQGDGYRERVGGGMQIFVGAVDVWGWPDAPSPPIPPPNPPHSLKDQFCSDVDVDGRRVMDVCTRRTPPGHSHTSVHCWCGSVCWISHGDLFLRVQSLW